MTSADSDQAERVRSENSGDAGWKAYERAIREGSRRYRPGKVCNRPQMSERQAGKPKRRQMYVFDDTAAGRAATRLSRKTRERAAPHNGGAAVQGGNAQVGLPLAGPSDATAGTQNRIGRAKGSDKLCRWINKDGGNCFCVRAKRWADPSPQRLDAHEAERNDPRGILRQGAGQNPLWPPHRWHTANRGEGVRAATSPRARCRGVRCPRKRGLDHRQTSQGCGEGLPPLGPA